jgi:hypothetical protein
MRFETILGDAVLQFIDISVEGWNDANRGKATHADTDESHMCERP